MRKDLKTLIKLYRREDRCSRLKSKIDRARRQTVNTEDCIAFIHEEALAMSGTFNIVKSPVYNGRPNKHHRYHFFNAIGIHRDAMVDNPWLIEFLLATIHGAYITDEQYDSLFPYFVRLRDWKHEKVNS